MSKFRPSVEFFFKIVHIPSEESTEVEVWCHELEDPDNFGSLQEWCQNAFNDEVSLNFDQIVKEWELDPTKSYQLIGKASVEGSYDPFGEYDEEVTIIECSKVELKFGIVENQSLTHPPENLK